MLVLRRKPGETIHIDSNIKVTVLSISGGRVRLGLAAPPEVPIHRLEIHGRTNDTPVEGVKNDSRANTEDDQ